MAKKVVIVTRDLFFRAKLNEVVRSAGGEVVATGGDLAVIELGAGAEERIRELVAQGVSVVAFGSHVNVDALRGARALGAVAVPNSEIENTLRELLASC